MSNDFQRMSAILNNDGWTDKEMGVVKLANIPAGTPFLHIDFEKNRNEVLIHFGICIRSNGIDVFGEPVGSYDFAHVGNLVGDTIERFHPDDITYREVSSRAKDNYRCKFLFPLQ